MGPTIGIIVPTRNRADQLTKTVKSLIAIDELHQILIVNDGEEELPDFNDLRVSICQNSETPGESGCVNLGWKVLTTDLICVVSDDDPQGKNWIPKILDEVIKQPNAVCWYPNTVVVKEGVRKRVTTASPYSEPKFLNYLRSPCLAGVLINAKRLKSLGVNRLRVPGLIYPNDLIQWLELSKYGEFVPCPNAESSWWLHNEQLSQTLSGPEKAKLYLGAVGNWVIQNQNSIPKLTIGSLALRVLQLEVSTVKDFRFVELRKSMQIFDNLLISLHINKIEFFKRFVVSCFGAVRMKIQNAQC